MAVLLMFSYMYVIYLKLLYH